jgi:hypothetical protein
VNGVLFAGRRIFDKIAAASRAMILDERFSGVCFNASGCLPIVAVPSVAAHGRVTLRVEVLTTKFYEIFITAKTISTQEKWHIDSVSTETLLGDPTSSRLIPAPAKTLAVSNSDTQPRIKTVPRPSGGFTFSRADAFVVKARCERCISSQGKHMQESIR